MKSLDATIVCSLVAFVAGYAAGAAESKSPSVSSPAAAYAGQPAYAAPRQSSSYRAFTGAYRNCSAARAAGAAPVRRGEPGYGPHLDRDNDGIGCE